MGFYKKYQPWSTALWFYFTVVLLDWTSSLISNGIPELLESNPFARDANLNFSLRKGMEVDLVWFIAYSLISITVYQVGKHLSPKLAAVCSAAVFAYPGYVRLMGAVGTNFLFVLRLYVAGH